LRRKKRRVSASMQ
jgi:Predicted endonuclease containing a URI domain